MAAVITLTTDFGARDPYMAEMKAVILGLNPAGIFTPILARLGWRAFELRATELRRRWVSATFHGRDVFAPAAAHLSLGIGAAGFGPPVTDPVHLAPIATREVGGGVDGRVIHVDRLHDCGTLVGGAGVLTVQVASCRMPVVRTYGELPADGAGALAGSHGRLEVAVREGSAAAQPRARGGATVRLSRSTTLRASWRTRS